MVRSCDCPGGLSVILFSSLFPPLCVALPLLSVPLTLLVLPWQYVKQCSGSFLYLPLALTLTCPQPFLALW